MDSHLDSAIFYYQKHAEVNILVQRLLYNFASIFCKGRFLSKEIASSKDMCIFNFFER